MATCTGCSRPRFLLADGGVLNAMAIGLVLSVILPGLLGFLVHFDMEVPAAAYLEYTL